MTRGEITKFLNEKDTYNTIMGILDYKLVLNSSKDILTDYPTHSFIAGGAIANTIYYLLNKNKFDSPIINDIDLFCVNSTNEPHQYFSHQYFPHQDHRHTIVQLLLEDPDYRRWGYKPVNVDERLQRSHHRLYLKKA
jgi:hypothetical protein